MTWTRAAAAAGSGTAAQSSCRPPLSRDTRVDKWAGLEMGGVSRRGAGGAGCRRSGRCPGQLEDCHGWRCGRETPGGRQ